MVDSRHPNTSVITTVSNLIIGCFPPIAAWPDRATGSSAWATKLRITSRLHQAPRWSALEMTFRITPRPHQATGWLARHLERISPRDNGLWLHDNTRLHVDVIRQSQFLYTLNLFAINLYSLLLKIDINEQFNMKFTLSLQ